VNLNKVLLNDILAARGATRMLIQPRGNAIDVELMLAPAKSHDHNLKFCIRVLTHRPVISIGTIRKVATAIGELVIFGVCGAPEEWFETEGAHCGRRALMNDARRGPKAQSGRENGRESVGWRGRTRGGGGERRRRAGRGRTRTQRHEFLFSTILQQKRFMVQRGFCCLFVFRIQNMYVL
jgi:hypothetical protein